MEESTATKMVDEKTMDKSKGLSRPVLVVLFTIALTIVTYFTTTQPIWANIPVNVIIPALILLKVDAVFFEKLKLTTLMTNRILIVLVVFGKIPEQFFATLNLVLLVVNIMEATLTDFKINKFQNALSGLLLVATIPFLKATWVGPYYVAQGYSRTSGAIIPMATVLWAIAYTIWNWIFVTNEFSPAIAMFHVAVLTTPLVGMVLFRNPGIWLIYRACSLTAGGNYQIVKKDYLEERLKSDKFAAFVEKTKTKKVQNICLIVNICLLAGVAYLSLR